MDNIKEKIEGNEDFAALFSIFKTLMRAILPLIGLEFFTKYFKEDEE